ncbi:DUF397 domain-containing protein [Actinomadura meridiana]|uniref:DUF397 domain-containing protein n=1 Tax=Actinomadura meridiana TaxID=559626 RepID=A0ABP8C570_9ACTN
MSEPVWRKSTRSGGANGGGDGCVELAAFSSTVGVRDSKAPGAGHLTLTAENFTQLITAAKADKLNI